MKSSDSGQGPDSKVRISTYCLEPAVFLQTASGILCLRRIHYFKKFLTGNETIPPPIVSNKTERHEGEGGEKVCGFFLKKETGQTRN